MYTIIKHSVSTFWQLQRPYWKRSTTFYTNFLTQSMANCRQIFSKLLWLTLLLLWSPDVTSDCFPFVRGVRELFAFSTQRRVYDSCNPLQNGSTVWICKENLQIQRYISVNVDRKKESLTSTKNKPTNILNTFLFGWRLFCLSGAGVGRVGGGLGGGGGGYLHSQMVDDKLRQNKLLQVNRRSIP